MKLSQLIRMATRMLSERGDLEVIAWRGWEMTSHPVEALRVVEKQESVINGKQQLGEIRRHECVIIET